ncbi:LAMI_0H01662g1_1 [Lachancea mirantina]|uniref:Coronin n=1 Tax=Lachancea mirantina TaxID=1230905 RepID=A0A1G4KDX2_9SACH|nr:LAMI_0H01662g1_1 [Lachancea mirantina]
MSGKFVRASKFRHVYGQAAKKELQYENIRVTNNAWDSNLIKANGKYIAVNWNASGGGAFAVIPVGEVGKAPDQVPLFRGHTAHVLDTDFNPFDDNVIVSGSDDAKIGVFEIPEGYSFQNYVDEEGSPKDIHAKKFLTGHNRKVGHVLFHPTAKNVLASSSLDRTVKIWDIDTGECLFTLQHPDMVTSMSFSYNGDHLVTVSRDKKLRVWDVRKEAVVSEGPAHTGAKNQRVVWLGNSDRIATTGFSKLSDRQIGIWDAFNLEKGDLGGFYTVDQSSGILMPFYDDSNKILYLVGKGDGNIRYFEFQNDELFELSEFPSTDPQRGFAVAPRRSVNVKDNEVLRGYKTVLDHCIEPVSFYVPRKSEGFQDDIYPDAPSNTPALTSREWQSGKSVNGPVLFNVKALYDGSDVVLTAAVAASETHTPQVDTQKKSPLVKESSAGLLSQQEQPSSPVAISTSSSANSRADEKAVGANTKSQADDALKKDESVDKLLEKARNLDEVNRAEDPSKDVSDWEDDNENKTSLSNKAATHEKKESVLAENSRSAQNCSSASKTTASSQKLEKTFKPETLKSDVSENGPATTFQVEQLPAKAEIKEQPNKASPSTELSSSNAPPAAKSMGLKQSVEKLSSLVIHLESVVQKLIEANIEKDKKLDHLTSLVENLNPS